MQAMSTVGLIGYGGIARDVVAALRDAGSSVEILAALCRPGRSDQARAALPGIDTIARRLIHAWLAW